MRSAVLLCAVMVTCVAQADDQGSSCNSWWSVADGVRHCLSGGVEVNEVVPAVSQPVAEESPPQPKPQEGTVSDEELYANHTAPSPDELPEREE